MNLFQRFAAAWAVLTASAFEAAEGKPELTEDNVAALEAAAEEVQAARTTIETLKGENQQHAETIAQMEAAAEAAATAVTTIREALTDNNVQLADDADVVAIAVEKINAWGASAPSATGVAPSGADDLGDDDKAATIYSDIDKRAQAAFGRNRK